MTGSAWLFVFVDQFYAKPKGMKALSTDVVPLNEEPT